MLRHDRSWSNYCVHLRISLCVLHTFLALKCIPKACHNASVQLFYDVPVPELQFPGQKPQSFIYCCCICSKYSIAYSSRMPNFTQNEEIFSFISPSNSVILANTFRRFFSQLFFHTSCICLRWLLSLFRLCKRD